MKATPKDVFLHLATVVALYITVGSLLVLLFDYINILFPDPLSYSNLYTASTRFAIASLIVVFPILLTITHFINRDIRKEPEKQNLKIRRWLLYLTLFIAGAIIVGDLIALLNTFLGGELTVRFVLKVLALFLVLATGFGYYFYELRGVWQQQPHLSRIFGWIVSGVVLVVLAGGFVIIGTPGEQRAARLDQERINDLQRLQSGIVLYWQETGTLPETLSDLHDPIRGFSVPSDPQTETPYTYEKTGALSFNLCATFAQESEEVGEQSRPRPVIVGKTALSTSSWQHPAGQHCFERTIDPERHGND